ncbi:ANR family transcriptional regulator [Pantoea stewartii]
MNQYARYATGAVRAERESRYGDAAFLWLKAQTSPCNTAHRVWAMLRHKFCTHADKRKWALLNKWILCCGTMKTVVSDNIKSMRYMLAYDGVLSGISVFYVSVTFKPSVQRAPVPGK